jgi:hypothetical protein
MSDDEDDYLSDKFLAQAAAASSSVKTYTERRKEEQRRAAIRNEQNKRKSRRELEQESRQEGLSRSLFEREKDDGDGDGDGDAEDGAAPKSKALAMMMKMGFKPGQALGQPDSPLPPASDSSEAAVHQEAAPDGSSTGEKAEETSKPSTQHRTVPLPLNEWTGELSLTPAQPRKH